MNFDLSDEQRLIRETARDFADREITPRARENDRNERFDLELVKRLGEMGYLGAPVAEQYGGRDLDYMSYGLVVEEIGRADSSARTVVSVQTPRSQPARRARTETGRSPARRCSSRSATTQRWR